jgi:hypothetical protein
MKGFRGLLEADDSGQQVDEELPLLGSDFETILQETGWFIVRIRSLVTFQPERKQELLAVCQDSILLLLFRANFSRESKVLYFSAFYKAACRIEQFLDKEGTLFVGGSDSFGDGVFL